MSQAQELVLSRAADNPSLGKPAGGAGSPFPYSHWGSTPVLMIKLIPGGGSDVLLGFFPCFGVVSAWALLVMAAPWGAAGKTFIILLVIYSPGFR